MAIQFLNSITDFIDSVVNAIISLISWIAQLASMLNNIDFNTSGLSLILGNYRFLVGDTIYMMHITAFYIGLFLIAIKVIPIFVSWWKQFMPF